MIRYSRLLLSVLVWLKELFFTSQSCVIDPLFYLGSVHQHSKGISEEQLARARLETPPVILYDWNTILKSRRLHINKAFIIIKLKKKLNPTCTLSLLRVWMTLRLICSRSTQSNGKTPVNVIHLSVLYACTKEWMNACMNMYQASSPKTACQHSEDSCLSDPWRSHLLQPSASSRGKTNINHQFIYLNSKLACDFFSQCTCFFHSGWTLLQYFMTMFLMCSFRRCSEACKAPCRICITSTADFLYITYLHIHLSINNDVSQQGDFLCVPQRVRGEVLASFCPKRCRAGFYIDSWGRSSVHGPGNTRSQGSIPHDDRWSLLWIL